MIREKEERKEPVAADNMKHFIYIKVPGDQVKQSVIYSHRKNISIFWHTKILFVSQKKNTHLIQ